MLASKTLYISHFEALQNVVRLHKSSSNALLEEISSLTTSNVQSIQEVSRYIMHFIPFCLSILWFGLKHFKKKEISLCSFFCISF